MSKLLGGILMAVGILIAGASGLCSLFFLASMATSARGQGGFAGLLPLVVLIGGIPFAIGFGLFRWGRAIVRKAQDDVGDTFN